MGEIAEYNKNCYPKTCVGCKGLQGYKNAVRILKQQNKDRLAEVEKLRKAVEWMQSIAKFFEYKAPEQVNTLKLFLAMAATAEDALKKNK